MNNATTARRLPGVCWYPIQNMYKCMRICTANEHFWHLLWHSLCQFRSECNLLDKSEHFWHSRCQLRSWIHVIHCCLELATALVASVPKECESTRVRPPVQVATTNVHYTLASQWKIFPPPLFFLGCSWYQVLVIQRSGRLVMLAGRGAFGSHVFGVTHAGLGAFGSSSALVSLHVLRLVLTKLTSKATDPSFRYMCCA